MLGRTWRTSRLLPAGIFPGLFSDHRASSGTGGWSLPWVSRSRSGSFARSFSVAARAVTNSAFGGPSRPAGPEVLSLSKDCAFRRPMKEAMSHGTNTLSARGSSGPVRRVLSWPGMRGAAGKSSRTTSVGRALANHTRIEHSHAVPTEVGNYFSCSVALRAGR